MGTNRIYVTASNNSQVSYTELQYYMLPPLYNWLVVEIGMYITGKEREKKCCV